jgi:Flp pilus assembly protein TadG
MATPLQKLRGNLRSFYSHGGNVAITFALAILPLGSAVGAAVDYSHANSIKAELQSASDATALAMSKNAATLSASDLQAQTTAYFKAVFNRPEALNVTATPVYTAGSSTLTVSSSAMMKTDFLGIMGKPNLTVSASSVVTWGGSSKLQVALVLDNTGSMYDSGKIFALKDATHQLLSQLKNAAQNPHDINVAIIPFTTDVNVGASNYNANWLDWTDWNADNGQDTSTATCTTTTTGKNGKPTKMCSTSTTWVPNSHSTWSGCVTDRDQDYDVKNTKPNPADASLPASAASTLFPTNEPLFGCPAPIMTLTNDWTALNNLVDKMTPLGATNQTIGLAWGLQALTQGPPLNAPAPAAGTQQIIILLTDGLNTANRWVDVLFGGGSASTIDARTQLVCNNIKGAGITLYTIQVNTGNDPTSTLLQNCASDSTKFFLLKTAGQMVTTFNQIGTNLSKLRIAQ